MGGQSPGLPPQGRDRSPTRKKARGPTFNFFDERAFPSFKTIPSGNTEMFLHIKSEVEGKKMNNLNRFKLEYHLGKITKNWSKASFNREGDLVLKVNDGLTAERLMKTKSIGEYKVNITRHEFLNCSKGVIFCPDLADMSEVEIKEGLALFHPVKDIYVPKRTPKATNYEQRLPNQTPRPFGLVIITFDQLEPPKKVNVGFRKVEVRPYVPNPRKCRTCQKLGHTAKFCPTGKEICGQCGQEKIDGHVCSDLYCVNCDSKEHSSVDSKCPKWIMWKELESIMAHQKKTRYEARKLFFESYGDEMGFVKYKGMSMAERLKVSEERGKVTKTCNQTISEEKSHPTTSIRKNTASTFAITKLNNSKTTTFNDTMPVEKTAAAKETSARATEPAKNITTIIGKIPNLNNNSLRLVSWEVRKDGTSYFLRNLCTEGVTPILDLKKFKKPTVTQTEHIKVIKEIFETCSDELKNQIRANPKCDFIEVYTNNGLPTSRPIFGKLKGKTNQMDAESSGDSSSEKEAEVEMMEEEN